VLFRSFVSEEELLEGIARAHVGVVAAKRDSFRNLTHTQKMYEYVAMCKPVVIAETPAVLTHFDDSCFQFFRSDDPVDLARALRDLYYDPERALDMVEAASRRYRAYAWEAQRFIYRDAVLGLSRHYLADDLTSWERATHATSGDLVAVPVEAYSTTSTRDHMTDVGPAIMVPVTIEAIPSAASIDRSSIVTPMRTSETEVSS